MLSTPAYVWNMASLFSAEMLKTPKSGKLLQKEKMCFVYFFYVKFSTVKSNFSDLPN